MSLARGGPFGDLMEMRRAMDRFLGEPWWTTPRHHHYLVQEFTPIDMYQTDEELIAHVALPGVKPEDVDITFTGDSLRIKGEVKPEREVKREDYFCQECQYGTFSRTLSLPVPVQTDKAEATFERGVLTITIPKAKEHKPKTIKVKAVAEAAKK